MRLLPQRDVDELREVLTELIEKIEIATEEDSEPADCEMRRTDQLVLDGEVQKSCGRTGFLGGYFSPYGVR